MSPFAPRPRRFALGRILVAFGVLASMGSTARSGWDDFEFGRRLADKGYIEYARQVYDRIKDDEKRPQGERDQARYGLALLGKVEVGTAQANPTVSYADVKAKYEAAVASIGEFVQKYPSDPKADEARGETGGLRLEFVTWASDLMENAENMQARAAKGDQILSDAQAMLAAATDVYGTLKTSAKTADGKQIAEFQWVRCQFYKGLTFAKCSAEARTAFAQAKTTLEDYASANEQYLTGTFALDFLGQTMRELGDCESDDAEKWKKYFSALDWFKSCADTEDQGEDFRRIITTGYLHIGKLANHAGGMETEKGRAMLKAANDYLGGMIKRVPRAQKMEFGVLSMVEHALILATLGKADEAVKVLKQASDLAQSGGFDRAQRRANSVLRQILTGPGAGTSGGASGDTSVASVDPSILMKVAEDQYANGKYQEAIPVYQKVTLAAGRDRDSLAKFYLPAWNRIGQCYANLKLPVESCAAFDVVADELRAGRIVLTSDQDPIGKACLEALNRLKAGLKEIADRTGDPVARDRNNKFLDEYIKFTAPIAQSSGTDVPYSRARQLWGQALEEREKSPAGEGWKKAFADAKPYFVTTAKNVKSEYQDVAWVYLARIAYEVGDYDGVAKAVDEALAYWETPEAKGRIATDEKLAGARKGQLAAVTYWKAAALTKGADTLLARKDEAGAKARYEAALVVLDPYAARFGTAAADYRSKALGLRVEALVGAGRVDDGEKALADLIQADPDYFNLPKLIAIFADRYRQREKEIQEKIGEVVKEEIGTPDNRNESVRSRLRALEREEGNLSGVISDLNLRIDRNRLIVEKSENAKEKELAEIDLKESIVKRDAAVLRLKKVRDDLEVLSKRRAELVVAKEKLQQDLVAPLRRTAELYRQLDGMLKEMDAKAGPGAKRRRVAANAQSLGFRYYQLGRIEDKPEDWRLARDIFEEWLTFPEVKAMPAGDDTPRAVQRLLGEIYYRIARTAKTQDETRTAFENAVKAMQNAVAKLPANTGLVVGQLALQYGVLEWPDPVLGRKVLVPVPKMTEVGVFKEYVAGLGGDRLPRFVSDKADQEYQSAVKRFQGEVARMTDVEAKRIVGSLKNPGFDVRFFAEHAYAGGIDFLMSLAHAYAGTGTPENGRKAANVVKVILNGPSKVEDGSAEWWEAQTIGFDVTVAAVERSLSAEGPTSAEAKVGATQASRFLVSMKQLNPTIGGTERREATVSEWKAIQARLVAAASKLGMSMPAVDVEAKAPLPPPEPAAPPPTPAPPAPAPTDPGMK